MGTQIQRMRTLVMIMEYFISCGVEPVNDTCGSGEDFLPVEDSQIFVWSNNRGYRSYHSIFSYTGKNDNSD